VGVPAIFNQIRNLPISEGRWINEMDDSQKRAVIVIGDEVNRTLFPGKPALGSTVLLNGIRFQVIGVLQKVGHGDNMNLNLRSFVPFHTMQQYFRPFNVGSAPDVISFINYQPKSRAVHEAAKQEVHKIIARNHGFDPNNPDSFDEWDTVKTVDQVGKIFDAMNLFLGSVGLVTLALGAIGIINIMLVAVADRTREIGLRKAVGATNGSIMFQFFVEGAFLTLLSGGIGIARPRHRRSRSALARDCRNRCWPVPCPPRRYARTSGSTAQGITNNDVRTFKRNRYGDGRCAGRSDGRCAPTHSYAS